MTLWSNRMLHPGSMAVIVLVLAGCAGEPTTQPSTGTYRTISVQPQRDTEAAQKANQAGLDHLSRNELDAAAAAFKEALTADVEFGPAHNNLGKVYFKQQNWHAAAWEFEYARKEMPRRAEPCNNLGLVLERAGELDRAVGFYHEAIGIEPDNIEYRANLVRALIGRGDRTDEVRTLLQQVIAKDTRPDWLIWARQQQAGMTPDIK